MGDRDHGGFEALPVQPGLRPMLARLSKTLPEEPGLLFEPKWDGFRCLAFRAGRQIAMISRNTRPLERYFPELEEAFAAVGCDRFVIDGEIVVSGPAGLDFGALLGRLHPAASVVQKLRRDTPASFVAFDLVAIDGEDLREAPFAERRARLERLLGDPPTALTITAITDDRATARHWLESLEGSGVDGVVAKRPDLRYEPGRRVMVKVKPERTAECVVGGFRPVLTEELAVASLLLGLYDDGALRHVGVVASFTDEMRRRLVADLAAHVADLEGHPWEHGFGISGGRVGRLAGAAGRWTPDMPRDWVPLGPELVCEVAYDTWAGDRFRHAARFGRWRPDRDPRSCTFDQFPRAGGTLARLLGGGR